MRIASARSQTWFCVFLALGCSVGLTCVGLSNAARAEIPAEKMEQAIAGLKERAEKSLAEYKVPGIAIAIVHNGKATYLNYGVREIGKPEPVTEDTVFQLASVSKPITTTILAKLVGEGKFAFDDAVSKYDPQFRLSDPYVTSHVTFRDLLSHRSGLPDHAGDLLEDLGYNRDEILARIHFFDLQNRWRAKYAYTNFGLTAAAVAGAKASGAGLSWEDLCQRSFYEPLGMKSTSGRFADFLAAKNRAVGHVPADGKWLPNATWAPLLVREPDAQSPAGGVSSCTRDLVRWMQLTLGRGIIDGKAFIDPQGVAEAEALAKETGRSVDDLLDEKGPLAETHTATMIAGYNPATGQSQTYALGWNVSTGKTGLPMWSHSGEFAYGARTVVAHCPKENFGIVVLVNAAPTGVPEGLQFDFFDLVLLGKVSPPPGHEDWLTFTEDRFRDMTVAALTTDPTDFSKPAPTKQPATLEIADYAASYDNPCYGKLTIEAAQDGQLVMTLGPKDMKFPLSHYSGDTFFFTTQGEMQTGFSGAVFKLDGKKIVSVTLNAYNIEGPGVFERAP